MTSADIIQIITSATAFMVALSTAVVLVIKELRSVSAKVEAVSVKADSVAVDQNARLDVIHENGNAHLKLMTDKLAASEARNEKLLVDSRAQMDERMKTIEALLETRRIEDREVFKAATQALEPVKVQIEQPVDSPVPVDPIDQQDIRKKKA